MTTEYQPELVSAIIPVSERQQDLEEVAIAYQQVLRESGYAFEMIFVLDGPQSESSACLERLQAEDDRVVIVTLARRFSDSTATVVGLDNSRGDVLITLPPYLQVEPTAIPSLICALEDCDLALARRLREQDSGLNRIRSRLFNAAVSYIGGTRLGDAGCEVRAMRRSVIDEVNIYGDMHRFIPLLAHRQGFRIKEIDVEQAQADKIRRVYRPGIYLRRALDLLSVLFIVKFTKKPLRFFGLIGSAMLAAGAIGLAIVVAQRFFGDVALADRPALLLAVLTLVLGVQIIAIGFGPARCLLLTQSGHSSAYTVQHVCTENGVKFRTPALYVP